MDKRYIVEYMGTVVIMTANFLTESDPVVIGIVYFAVLWMSQGITSGFFNPFIPIYTYMMSRGTTQDVVYNLFAQVFGAISSILLFKPLKTYLD